MKLGEFIEHLLDYGDDDWEVIVQGQDTVYAITGVHEQELDKPRVVIETSLELEDTE